VSEEKTIRHIFMITREYDGLAGAGGVKDVCRQLAEALVQHGGHRVQVLLPRYGFIDPVALGFVRLRLPCPGRDDSLKTTSVFEVDMNYPGKERREPVSIWEKTMHGVQVGLLDSPRFVEKLGVYTYTPAEEAKNSFQQAGNGHFDYFAMNILLQKAALDMLLLFDLRPDIIHCHDGHAATLPAMMWENSGYRHFFCRTGAVVTIHNAGMGYHQEVDDLHFAEAITGLPESVIRSGLLGRSFDPFVVAADYAHLNTVSENYARELQESDEDSRTGWLGHHLLKKGIQLAGITNGINPEDFNPRDPERMGLAAAFDPAQGDLAGKWQCKKSLLTEYHTVQERSLVQQYGCLGPAEAVPLFTFIGRLTAQKGVDILLQALSLLTEAGEHNFQVLILGSGEKYLEEQLQQLTETEGLAGRLCFLKGYAPALAMQIYAAGDFFLIPSLYEPCGLTDYISQLFGNLPIVHHVGGLVKVLHQETGFAYQQHTPQALAGVMQEALHLYRLQPQQIQAMQRAAVERIHSRHTWKQVMQDYLVLYQQALQ
jgi:starch synthase